MFDALNRWLRRIVLRIGSRKIYERISHLENNLHEIKEDLEPIKEAVVAMDEPASPEQQDRLHQAMERLAQRVNYHADHSD